MRNRLKKRDILTIPNFLSFFRLLLIPVLVWLYCSQKKYNIAAFVIAISAVTDIADGKIARKYNMVTDFGKIIDPIADKLTQASLILCLIPKYRWMTALVILFVIKEGFMLMAGYMTLKLTDTVNSAKWHGKVSTVVLYTVIMILVLFPRMPETATNILIGLCGAAMIISLMLYGRFYIGIFKNESTREKRKYQK